MNDMEAFEAWHDDKNRPYPNGHECPHRYWERQAWQAALAYERAKPAEPVPFNAPGKAHVEAMLGSAAPPAVQAEPVLLNLALRLRLARRCLKQAIVQGEPVAFVITDEKINFLQVNSIKRFIERAKHAHFTDIYYRINGKDEVVQADWLKHLQLAAPPADDEAVRLLREARDKLIAYRDHTKNEYPGGPLLVNLLPAIDAYLAKVGK